VLFVSVEEQVIADLKDFSNNFKVSLCYAFLVFCMCIGYSARWTVLAVMMLLQCQIRIGLPSSVAGRLFILVSRRKHKASRRHLKEKLKMY